MNITKPSEIANANKNEARVEGIQDRRYKQFYHVKTKGFLSTKCPACNLVFGLDVKLVEQIGEVAYLVPFSCPYCSGSFTLKN